MDKGTWISSVMFDILCLITWPTDSVKKQEQGKAKPRELKHVIYSGEKQDSRMGRCETGGRGAAPVGIEMGIWVWLQPATPAW